MLKLNQKSYFVIQIDHLFWHPQIPQDLSLSVPAGLLDYKYVVKYTVLQLLILHKISSTRYSQFQLLEVRLRGPASLSIIISYMRIQRKQKDSVVTWDRMMGRERGRMMGRGRWGGMMGRGRRLDRGRRRNWGRTTGKRWERRTNRGR